MRKLKIGGKCVATVFMLGMFFAILAVDAIGGATLVAALMGVAVALLAVHLAVAETERLIEMLSDELPADGSAHGKG